MCVYFFISSSYEHERKPFEEIMEINWSVIVRWAVENDCKFLLLKAVL